MFYDVNLSNLALGESTHSTWPSTHQNLRCRMVEECLESVVATNLATLFPGERTLLVGTQDQLNSAADVTAIDSLGLVRLMELKQSKIRSAELVNQVIAYAVGQVSVAPTAWRTSFQRTVTELPERVQLSAEGVRQNRRTKGEIPEHARTRWRSHHLITQLLESVNHYRAMRSAPSGPVGLESPEVLQAVVRILGTECTSAEFGDVPALVERVLSTRDVDVMRQFTEATMIAPAFDQDVGEATRGLEERGVLTNRIEGEIRQGSDGTVILRWEPVARTVPSNIWVTLNRTQRWLSEHHPNVPRLVWRYRRDFRGFLFGWRNLERFFIWVHDDPNLGWTAVARADSLTPREGLQSWRKRYDHAAQHVRGRHVALDHTNIESLGLLFLRMHAILSEIGALDEDLCLKR